MIPVDGSKVIEERNKNIKRMRMRERERQRQRQRHTERKTETETHRENSNSKTLFYKDCSLASVKNVSNNWSLLSFR